MRIQEVSGDLTRSILIPLSRNSRILDDSLLFPAGLPVRNCATAAIPIKHFGIPYDAAGRIDSPLPMLRGDGHIRSGTWKFIWQYDDKGKPSACSRQEWSRILN